MSFMNGGSLSIFFKLVLFSTEMRYMFYSVSQSIVRIFHRCPGSSGGVEIGNDNSL